MPDLNPVSSHSRRDWVASVLWYGLLVLTIPGIQQQWSVMPADFLTTWYGYLYLGFCLLVSLLYIGVCKQRRLVLLAFAVTLLALQVLHASLDKFINIGWDRIAIVILGLAALVILYEAIRQNIPFFRDCHRKQIPIGRLTYRSLMLWSPLMVFLLIGVMANNWILASSKDFIYQTLPVIDEYCVASTIEGERVIPCTGLKAIVTPKDITSLKLEENIRFHIRRAFLKRQKEILEDLKAMNNSGKNVSMSDKQFWDVVQKMRPADILKLDDELYRLYKQLKSIKKQINQIRKRVAEIEKSLDKSKKELRKLKKKKSNKRSKRKKKKIHKEIDSTLATINSLNNAHSIYENNLAMRKNILLDIKSKLVSIAENKYSDVGLERDNSGKDKRNNWEIVTVEHIAITDTLEDYFYKQRKTINSHTRRKWWKPVGEIETREGQLVEYFINMMNRLNAGSERIILNPKARTLDKIVEKQRNIKIINNNYDVIVLAVLDVEPQCKTQVNTRPFECFAVPEEGLPIQSLGLKKSADESIEFWHEQQARDIQERFRTALKEVSKNQSAAKREARSLFDTAIPKEVVGKRPKMQCRKLELACHVGNGVGNRLLEEANDDYNAKRNELWLDYKGLVIDSIDDGASYTVDKLWDAKEELSKALATIVQQLHDSVDYMNTFAIVLSAFLTFILVLAVIKSFLYVLATELFDSRELANIELDRGTGIEGEFVAGSSLTIPRSFAQPLITKTVLDNQALRKVVAAWPLSAPFGRILKGAYFFFNKGTHRAQSSNPMSFSQAEGKSIVDWHMQEGEEVVFHYRNFFGASENIKLKTTISLRLPTLLLGRFVFHSACCTDGPGRLLLVTSGQVVEDQNTIDSTPLDRLIAYSKHTRFKVDSERTIRSVFMDGYTIVRVKEAGRPSGLMLVEAISSKRSMLTGSLRFVKTMLLPF